MVRAVLAFFLMTVYAFADPDMAELAKRMDVDDIRSLVDRCDSIESVKVGDIFASRNLVQSMLDLGGNIVVLMDYELASVEARKMLKKTSSRLSDLQRRKFPEIRKIAFEEIRQFYERMDCKSSLSGRQKDVVNIRCRNGAYDIEEAYRIFDDFRLFCLDFRFRNVVFDDGVNAPVTLCRYKNGDGMLGIFNL